jgi:hypothetical protein
MCPHLTKEFPKKGEEWGFSLWTTKCYPPKFGGKLGRKCIFL